MDKNLRNSGDYFVSLAPHIRSNDTVQRIMLDVLVALVPAAVASIYFLGLCNLTIMTVSVRACVLSEYVFQKLMKKPIQVKDLSVVVTGILLAFDISAGTPLRMVAFGGVLAIIIVKECFGGIGGNFINPALTARVMLMASWPQQMITYVQPDGMTGTTPLQILKKGGGNLPSLMDMPTGNIGGVTGRTRAIALILGGIYLLVRKVTDWKTPVTYIVSTAIFLLLFGVKVDLLTYEVLGGGLLLGAIFMATDYSSSPMNVKGKIIFTLGAGLITAVIRAKGGMPEGVSCSILLMNVCTPLTDRSTVGEAYGPKKA